MRCFDGLFDEAGDDNGVRRLPRGTLKTLDKLPRQVLVGRFGGPLYQAVHGDSAPFGGNAPRFDHDHIDAEIPNLVPEAVAQTFQGKFAGVIPSSEGGRNFTAHGGYVNDLSGTLLPHVR